MPNRQVSASLRRKDYYNAVLNILNRLPRNSRNSRTIPRARVFRQGALYFLEQVLSSESWVTLECFRKIACTLDEADRVMMELLDAVQTLHEAGVLNCALTREDVWLITAPDGLSHPALARPQRFLLTGRMPEREDVDIEADILAPEMCLYLGTQSEKERRNVAQWIDERTDIFSLGLIYHALLCGDWPSLASPEYLYLGLSAQSENGMLLSAEIETNRRSLISVMTSLQPQDRPESCFAVKSMILNIRECLSSPQKAETEYGVWRPVQQEELHDVLDFSDSSLFSDSEENKKLYLDF